MSRPPPHGGSDDDDEDYFTPDEDVPDPGGQAAGLLQTLPGQASDYGLGCKGQIVIGGQWVDAAAHPLESRFRPTDDVGWDQPSPRESAPLTEEEVADQVELARLVGEEGYRTLPADLQLGYVRDFYGPASRGAFGWEPEEAYEKTAELIQLCVKWRAEIDAERLASAPLTEREREFRRLAPADLGPAHGADGWGHPRMWCRVTGWPPIAPAVRKEFSAEEVRGQTGLARAPPQRRNRLGPLPGWPYGGQVGAQADMLSRVCCRCATSSASASSSSSTTSAWCRRGWGARSSCTAWCWRSRPKTR